MIPLLVLSWPKMMTTVVAYALRSPIHSLQVAASMNYGRDAIVLVVAEVKSTCLVQHIQLQTRMVLPSTTLSAPSLHVLAIPSP